MWESAYEINTHAPKRKYFVDFVYHILKTPWIENVKFNNNLVCCRLPQVSGHFLPLCCLWGWSRETQPHLWRPSGRCCCPPQTQWLCNTTEERKSMKEVSVTQPRGWKRSLSEHLEVLINDWMFIYTDWCEWWNRQQIHRRARRHNSTGSSSNTESEMIHENTG